MDDGSSLASRLGGEALTELRGLGIPLVDRLGLVPRSARWVLPTFLLAFAGHAGSCLEHRIRTLALLRVAALEHSPYWRETLGRTARALAIPHEEVELLRSDEWEVSAGLEPRERSAVLWADRVVRRLARRDRTAYEAARRWFDDEAFVELTLVASIAVMACRVANALRLPVGGQHADQAVPRPVPAASLGRWVERTFDVNGVALPTEGEES